jgi:hypothetical protein
MRIPTSALAVATLVAVSIAPASAAYRSPLMQHGSTQARPVGHVVPLSQAAQYKNPVGIPQSVKQEAIKRISQMVPRHMKAFRHPGGGVSEFLTDDSGYIFELSSKGAVIGYLTDCSGAEGMKVDHAGNLYVACTNTSTVNIYAPGASYATTTYVDDPGGVYYYAADAAVDGFGDVYASSLYAFSCTTYSCTFYPGQISAWAAGDASGSSPDVTIPDANINEEAFFTDVDEAGSNLYVDYFGCNTSDCGYAADWIAATSSGIAVTTFVPFGGLEFPGAVLLETGKKGSTAGVIVGDQLTRLYTEYTGSGSATGNVYGPSPENIEGSCDPVSGGLSKGNKSIALGDAGCHALITGKLKASSWSAAANINYSLPIGAGYSKSNR